MAYLNVNIFVIYLFICYMTVSTVPFVQAIVCGRLQVTGQATAKFAIIFPPAPGVYKVNGDNLEKSGIPQRVHIRLFLFYMTLSTVSFVQAVVRG